MGFTNQKNKLTVGSYDESSFILINCITPVHVGAERSSSTVDLAIQKDMFGYPTIFSSSLKGAIRQGNEDEIYGSNDYAGAFTPLDAKLLFIPVRSLFGVYCLATSPFLLRSFKSYLDMCALNDKFSTLDSLLSSLRDIYDPSIIVSSEHGKKNFGIPIADDNNSQDKDNDNSKYSAILADEFRLKIKVTKEMELFVKEIGMNRESTTKGAENFDNDKWRIVVVSDDLLRNSILNRSLITSTRIKIENGVAKQNALWTEESLPEKTILYTVFFYSKSRGKDGKSSIQVQKDIEGKIIDKYVLFGGHETTGKGITKVTKVV